ncbi:MAG: glycosyltransferase, partial [Deltaproteobacteria bacterium]|nr:glycosyltransferase [Deltaproteobacteria bacterium]
EQRDPLAAKFVVWAGRDCRSTRDLTLILRDELGPGGFDTAVCSARTALGELRWPGFGKQAFMNLHTAMTRAMSFEDLGAAIRFGESYLHVSHDQRLLRTLVIFHRRSGDFQKALDRLESLDPDPWNDKTRVDLLRNLDVMALRRTRKELILAIDEGEQSVRAAAKQIQHDISPERAFLLLFQTVAAEFKKTKNLSGLVIEFGEELAKYPPPLDDLAFIVCDAHLHQGNITAAISALDRLGGDEDLAAKRQRVAALNRLRQHGLTHRVERSVADEWLPDPARILVPLHNSLPHDSGGYASRTHGLLSNIRALGWNIDGVTRLGYPQDRSKHRNVPLRASSCVDDITYFRLHEQGRNYGQIPIYDYLCGYADALYELAARERPEIIYAPSNYMNGVAANAVGRALGIKTVYEVRGLWEITRISRQPDWEGSEYFEMMHNMEVQAALEADAVTCITEALKAEMVARGVPAEKITIVPNGVDTDRFVPMDRDETLARELGLEGKRVIGYIGSVVDYEGLDDLLRAVALLKQRDTPDFGVLIVGDGAVLNKIKTLTTELDLDDIVVFTGRVPHAQVEKYYSVIDIAPFPRKSLPVTEMVSPLKPFEAMAMEKIVIASNVAALEEIVSDGVNGYLFTKGDCGDLANKLERVLSPDSATELRPRQWVIEHRDWRKIARICDGVFKSVTSPLEPATKVALSAIRLTEEVSTTLDEYRRHYASSSPAHVRRDDYARWSEVARRIAHETTLLDVGIGIGQFVNAMAMLATFERIVGVDKEAHSLLLRLRDGFDLDLTSIEMLPYPDGAFDVVTCMETLEHLPESIFLPGIEQLRRVCAKQLIITVPFREETLSKGHLRRFDFEDLERLFPDGQVTLFHKSTRKGSSRLYWALIEERY